MADDLTLEFKEEVKKQATQQAAKWILAAIATLAFIAATGWWFYLKDKFVTLAGGVPKGAVVAFDLADGCPDGWKQVPLGWTGRTIVPGVSDATNTYGYRKTGGAAAHALTVDEMPEHQHGTGAFFAYLRKLGPNTIDLSSLPVRGVTGNAKLTDLGSASSEKFNYSKHAGGGKPHNNMPPYVALYFCKKGETK